MNIKTSEMSGRQDHTAELDRLGDEIALLSAHIEAATGRLLDLIREFDARGAGATASAPARTGSPGAWESIWAPRGSECAWPERSGLCPCWQERYRGASCRTRRCEPLHGWRRRKQRGAS